VGTTPEQGWTTPDNTTAPNTLGAKIAALAGVIEKQVVRFFSTAAARNSAVTAPIKGSVAWIDTPGQHTWWTGTAWRPLMTNVVQDIHGTTISGGGIAPGVAYTVFDQDVTVAGPCVLEMEVDMALSMGATAGYAGVMGANLAGIVVRNVRWNNHGGTGLLVPHCRALANIPAAGTYNVRFDINSDAGSAGSVTVSEVNYAIRELSPR
jgi:hypothetical protein